MVIPKHDEIREPALQLLSQHESLKLKEFESLLAVGFGLTSEDLAVEYESGNARIFYDRISWALSYLNMAGLVEKPRRGVYQISDLGRTYLGRPEALNGFVAKKVNKDKGKKGKPKAAVSESAVEMADRTPQESLYESAESIRQAVYSEILDVILSKTPMAFEKLVVRLLQRMGYGGEVKAAGVTTQYSNDGGIDGIIKEDVLGLGRIYIQVSESIYNVIKTSP